MIGMGDYLECAHKASGTGAVYEQVKSPQEQYESIMELFKPIKKKIIGLHSGNHEWRAYRDTGIDLTKNLARELNTTDLGFACFTKLKLGKQNYDIYSTHGASGSWTPEGKMRAIRKLSESFDADLYLYGHVHDISIQTEESRKIDDRSRTVKRRKKYYVNTGHFLNYEGSYAEMKNYKPGKKGVVKIKFYRKKFDIHASV